MPSIDESVEAFNLLFKLRTSDEELSDVNISDSKIKNKRTSPRYVRDDIVVALCEPSTFSHKEIFLDFVKLNDISSRGMAFSTTFNLHIQKKVILHLHFYTEKTFKINATIIYRLQAMPYQYGVKFEEENPVLADHLLETQRKLILK